MEMDFRDITSDLNSVVIQFLRNIKTIVDRAYFHPYYKKSNFEEDVKSIDDLGEEAPKTSFSFVPMEERLMETYTGKEVLEVLKESDVMRLVEVCIEIFYTYSEIMFRNHNHVIETYAIEVMGYDVARCTLSLQRVEVFDTTTVEAYAMNHIKYMIKTIGSIDSVNCKYGITLYHEMSVIILHYKNIRSIERFVIEELCTIFTNFLRYLESGEKLSAWHSESFAILLNIAYEVIENCTLISVYDVKLKHLFSLLTPVFDGLCLHFPDYIQDVIQNCVYLIRDVE
ncbi:PREDICTED: uncharacterized protein LOC108569307 [Nicrophorus vespilloides]|uniref:Uncharacterized protein LOC108569307 n=1 Tax=Nicrophorus vespilloides TaxID=110193 RepID=A0ABM1NHK2_NICVS|nr:PREDICTED: uncharacterized protein LOC108569307 [Nicrophorus vespilloides]